MQDKANILVESLREFISQPDYPTLVLNGTDASMVFPNRILAALDRQDEEAYYLLFPEPCLSAVAYMDGIAKSLQVQVEVFSAELAARGLQQLPPLPLQVGDGRYPAAQRLRAAIDYTAQHLPPGPIVWGLLPGELVDAAGYRTIVDPLLAHQAVEPWMDRHRFIIRDQETAPFLLPPLLAAKNDRVLVMEVQFSNEQVVDGLVETAQDRRLPPDERMNAFFQLAAVDFAFKRYPEALQKYGAAFNYFEERGNKPMQMLCLSGAGDTLRQAGRPAEAVTFYQQSLALSVEERNMPAMQPGLYGAGCACLEAGRDQDAEGYLLHASNIAGKLNNPYAKCDAMEKLGVARWRLGKIPEAIEIWVKAKDLAKLFAYVHRAQSVLDYLIVVCQNAGLSHRVVDFQREKAALSAAEGAPQA